MDLDYRLLQHLQNVTGLESPVLEKVLDEISVWYTRDTSTWIKDRHQELQSQGLRNREIFPRLREEAKNILVRADALSERQIRRMIYG